VTGVPAAEKVRETFARYRPVDLDTNFFEAGFTSQTLIEILDRLREVGLPLVLVDLYRFPTVRAVVAEAHRRADPARPVAGPALPWAT
jgi:aryl carrier-like protein